MLIKQLVLHNFRVFNGTHTIDLAPRKRPHEVNPRPIVLFGGLNGAGKTSILSAIRLALYGRLAFGLATQQQDYIEHLSSLIHKGAYYIEQPEEAAVELTFTYNKGGQESEFTVTRTWKKGKKDRLSLQKDGQPLSELDYDQCQGFLNELIPHGIADLFFFDGEKIADMAVDETNAQLKDSIRSMLGIGVLDVLRNDIGKCLRRVTKDLQGNNSVNEILNIRAERESLEKQAQMFESELETDS